MRQSRWFKWLVVILIVLLIVWLVDIEQTWGLLKGADIGWLSIAFLIIQLQVVLSAIRWKVTATRLGQNLKMTRAISEYYLATLANLSLPGGVTGDAARVYRSRDDAGWHSAIMSVSVERLSGQLVLFAVALLGWLSWPLLFRQQAPVGLPQLLLVFIILCLLVVTVIVFLSFMSTRVRRFTNDFRPAMRRVWIDDRQWIVQLSLSLAIIASYVVVFALSAKSLSEPLPGIAFFTVIPMVLLSMVIPLSIAGWGIRELAAASLWPVVGLAAEAGIATSIVYGLVSMVSVVPGVLVCLVINRRSQSDKSFDARL